MVASETSSPLHGGMIGLVALSNSWAEFSLDELRLRLEALYAGHFLPGDQASFVVEGSVPEVEFMIKSVVPGASGLFLLHSVPAPYTDVSDFDRSIADPALRDLARAQACWLSVDLLDAFTSEAESWRFIARALAALAPRDSAVLVHPGRRRAVAFDREVRRRLARGEEMFATA